MSFIYGRLPMPFTLRSPALCVHISVSTAHTRVRIRKFRMACLRKSLVSKATSNLTGEALILVSLPSKVALIWTCKRSSHIFFSDTIAKYFRPGGLGQYGLHPEAGSFFGGNVTAAVNNGTISEARIDDMVRNAEARSPLVLFISQI